MKLWTTEHTFNHSWQKVTEGVWKKYPNEYNPNVLAIDVLDRKISPDGELITTRIIGSQWNLPKLITTLLGMPEMCYAVEHSEVEVKNQKMTLKTVNYTFWGILGVEETLVYQGNKENQNETHLSQGAKISVHGIQFSNYFEDLLVSNFDATSIKGRTALEQVIRKIKIENILDAVSDDIKDLKCNLDELDNEFHMTEKLQTLGKDLDNAADLINSELKIFSSKISTEFLELISTLGKELDQITTKISILDNTNIYQDEKVTGLTEAVRKAGFGIATI